MSMTRVRVRRERPTALAWALALCVTMLVVYVLTLNAGRPDVVESMADIPRVTRELSLEPLEGWCVSLAECDTAGQARIRAAACVSRGAAGYVSEMDGKWTVLGALYGTRREAGRAVERLAGEEGLQARAIRLEAAGVKLRVTAPEALIRAVSDADALLRRQTRQLGDVALQLDHGEIRPDAVRTLCALGATEAAEASRALKAVSGAMDNGLCAALAARLDALSGLQQAVADDTAAAGAALSGMLRCVQIETFTGQRQLQAELAARKRGGGA